MVQIRFATIEDIPRIMKFIDEHWKKNHIMATNRILFEFQHVENDEVHYVIAEDSESKYIYGTMGYILMNRSEHPDIFTMMIQTLGGSGHELLGDEMSQFLREELSVRYVLAVGVNKRYAKAISIIEENSVDILQQYYRLNDRTSYHICKIVNKCIPDVEKSVTCTLNLLSSGEEFQACVSETMLAKLKPYRDSQYVCHRYFEHPFYHYHAYAIQIGGVCEGVLIGREMTVEETRCFRIVDYYGEDDTLRKIGVALDQLMKEKDYEYIDFCCYGMEESVLQEAGFLDAKKDNNIIPYYFEPFEQKMVDIYIYCDGLSDVRVYKAFSDQDRPNILK